MKFYGGKKYTSEISGHFEFLGRNREKKTQAVQNI